MSLKSIVQGIENLPAEAVTDVEGIFNHAEAAWNKLQPEVQSALKNGSGILAVINQNITGEYAPVVAIIESKFGVTSTQVDSVLSGLAKAFNIAIADTASGAGLLKALQTYLSGLGGAWSFITAAAAEVGANILSGADTTPLSIAIDLMRYVYLKEVKPPLAA